MGFAVSAPMSGGSTGSYSSAANINVDSNNNNNANPQHRREQSSTTATATNAMMATMTTHSANWGNTSTGQMAAADEATIDDYAMKVLEDASPSDVSVDADYLGPYITGVLRAEQTCASQLEDLPDYENVLELLQEHCSMARQDAKETLQKIAQAVMKGMVPVEYLYEHNHNKNNNHNNHNHNNSGGVPLVGSPSIGPFGSPPSSMNGMRLSALQLLEAVNVEAAAQEAPSARRSLGSTDFPHATISTTIVTTPNEHTATSVISPAQANNLIPVDLLGAIDYEDDSAAISGVGGTGHCYNYQLHARPTNRMHHSNKLNANTTTITTSTSTSTTESAPPHNLMEEEFPSLAVAAASKLTRKASRSSRSRQGSMDDSTVSEHSSTKKVSPHLQPQMAPPLQQQLPQQNPYYYGHGIDPSSSDPATILQMACDMLVSMNPDMGQDAIFQAATMAESNVGVAQYLMDCAMTAPPVCRHLLHAGCYRADCQFSHDLEGHTCVFWLRGRCGKGSACQFLHGYNDKWLIQLEEQQQQQHAEMEQAYLTTQQQQQQEQQQHDHHQQDYTYGGDGAWEQSGQASGKPPTTSTNSFANIASQGYNGQTCFQQQSSRSSGSANSLLADDAAGGGIFYEETKFSSGSVPTIKIPQDVWNPHERRDASAFHIADPMERYREVSRHHTQQAAGTTARTAYGTQESANNARTDVIDLHFQSTKTFAVVLEQVLPEKLALETQGVWIVTGTGHHVGSKTHQKGGGVLESAVISWLMEHGYDFWKGRDRNGHGGALFVKKMAGIGIAQ